MVIPRPIFPLSLTMMPALTAGAFLMTSYPQRSADASLIDISRLENQRTDLLAQSTLIQKTVKEIAPPDNTKPSGDSIPIATRYFTPPSNPRPAPNTDTTPLGTRRGSCLGDTDTAFTLLGSDATISPTVSTQPTFVWYLPAPLAKAPAEIEAESEAETETEIHEPVTVIFRLLTLNEANIPIPIYTAELDYQSGFSRFQLPSDSAELTVGEEYRWQVVVVCDPTRPSRSLAQERSFELITPPVGLTQALTKATTAEERALAYGQASLWYEAIAEVTNTTAPDGQTIRSQLLRELVEFERTLSENEPLLQDWLDIAEQ